MKRSTISKIKQDTCAHEATMFIAQQSVDWNGLLAAITNRLKTLMKRNETPDWAGHSDNVAAMLVVALFQRFSVQLMITSDEHPTCYELSKSLYDSFGLSGQLCDLLADFVLANDGVKDAITKRLREELSNLPWENN